MFSRTRGFAKAVLDGYEISGITRLQSGPYLTATGTGNAAFGNRRADCVSSDQLFPEGERGPNGWVRREAFAVAPDTRRGTCGVGTILGPGAHTWDFSLRRKFWIERRGSSCGSRLISSTLSTGRTSAIWRSNLSSAAFGTISTSGAPRNIQFGLKLTF